MNGIQPRARPNLATARPIALSNKSTSETVNSGRNATVKRKPIGGSTGSLKNKRPAIGATSSSLKPASTSTTKTTTDGKNDRAVRCYDAAAQKIQRKEFPEALKYLNKAVELEPSHIKYLEYRSFCHAKLGKFEEAITDAHAMIKLESKNGKGYVCAGNVFKMFRKTDRESKIYEIALRNVPDSDPSYKELKSRHETFKKKEVVGTPIFALPLELLFQVFLYLPLASRFKTVQVCKHWHASITNEKLLWTDMDLSAGRVSPAVINGVAKKSRDQLRSLVISDSRLKDKNFDPLIKHQCHKSLTRLSITDNYHVTAAGLNVLLVKSKLTSLNLSNTAMLSDVIFLKLLRAIPTLKELILCGAQIDSNNPADNLLQVAPSTHDLESLDVSQTSLGDKVLTVVSTFAKKLVSLNISNTPTTMSFLLQLKNFPLLESIDLTRISFPSTDILTQQGPLSLSAILLETTSSLPNLKCFRMLSCPKFDDACLQFLILNCPKLEELSIGFSANLTDAGCREIANLDHLKVLNLSNCFRVTTATLQEIFRECTQLQSVDASCLPVTDEELRLLAFLKDVDTVNVNGCSKITGLGIRDLVFKKEGKKLFWLGMDNCLGVNSEVVNLCRKSIVEWGGRCSARITNI